MPTKRAIMDVAGTRSSVSRRLICQAPGGPVALLAHRLPDGVLAPPDPW